jgi:parallel beta-helix repeat protein
MPQPESAATLYVNPATGNNTNAGSQAHPFKAIAHALSQAKAGTTIHLAAGKYSTANGETFPLVIPTDVVLQGDETSKGNGILIEGSGEYNSPTFGKQNITIRPGDNAQVRGVTITNPASQGTGVWIESTTPTIANNTFRNCQRDGILATGTANPVVIDNLLENNAASGIFFVRNAKGEIRRNLCRKTGYGIAVSDQAAPLIAENQLLENRSGIVLSRFARPVLRTNQVIRNQGDGLVVIGSAQPDLGKSQDPGDNVFQDNGGVDLRNNSTIPLTSAGNQLNPTRIVGKVEFVANEVSFSIPVPVLSPAPTPPITPTPSPSPVPSPTTAPIPTPIPPATPTPPVVSVQLTDIAGHWAEPFVIGLVSRKIINGFPDGSFKPEAKISRSEFAAILAGAFNQPLKQARKIFSDVPTGFWAAEAIAKAQQMGFIAGFPDQTFRPNDSLTRIQTIVALINGLELTGGDPSVLVVYSDRAQVPSYAVNAVATATQKRMVVNYPDVAELRPMAEINRAEVAAIIYQTLVARLQAPAVISPYIVNPPRSVPSFPDIEGHWAAEFIRGLASQGLISGFEDGNFNPEMPMNRAQYAALLAGTFNLPIKRPSPTFSDISRQFWAAPAIERVYQMGLLSGFDDNTFRLNEKVLRFQLFLSLANGLSLPETSLLLLNLYDDADEIPAYARKAIAAATAKQLVVNHPDPRQLDPSRAATRAEVAAAVYQALVLMARSPSIASTHIINPNAILPPPPTLVAIDPGHGGKDSGAIGIGGLRESDIVLPLALEIANSLQNLGIQVHLTRSDDRSLTLAERVQSAEQANADLFVSIHANSAGIGRPDINGLETYHYPGSTKGAALAQAIHNRIVETVTVRNRGIKQANFLVLRKTSMPASLIETGFVTGQQDAANLANANYRNTMARAIAQGILQFVQSR